MRRNNQSAHQTFLAGPVVRFMRDNINQLGGDIHSGNVRCRRCDIRQSGGFDPNYGIRICANELRNRGHLEDTMAHGKSTPTQIQQMWSDWRVPYQRWYMLTTIFVLRSSGRTISDMRPAPRSEHRLLAVNADLCANSGLVGNGKLHNSTRNV